MKARKSDPVRSLAELPRPEPSEVHDQVSEEEVAELENAVAEFDLQIASLEPEVSAAERSADSAELEHATKAASLLIVFSNRSDLVMNTDAELVVASQNANLKFAENEELCRRQAELQQDELLWEEKVNHAEKALLNSMVSKDALDSEFQKCCVELDRFRTVASAQKELFFADLQRLETMRDRLRKAGGEVTASALLSEADCVIALALKAEQESEASSCNDGCILDLTVEVVPSKFSNMFFANSAAPNYTHEEAHIDREVVPAQSEAMPESRRNKILFISMSFYLTYLVRSH
eukprot:CAMPEP_0194517608 /NCGR_PEP_ID=MMETSP0253-20130528/50823_1 /TAXON_ID=2966 /ORGANISM="Noctiluca scintillans" /LENGTH=291 /DNA_ID=CAMNT_0039361591 /DNA_START=220 /DNA_END=1093 /DNA_ORIENTATION=+